MKENALYKGFKIRPASEKSLNGKFFPRGTLILKDPVRQTTSTVLKTFEGEYLTKNEADSAFIEEAKKYIDITYPERN